jgi:NADP-dependent 3-hydroxy acid dehydrogenase YdfG
MTSKQKSVLITGCSAGGIGEALAAEFHSKGWLVFATARNLEKVKHLKELGCEILELDVTKDETIRSAVKEVGKKTNGILDMLINNAGMSVSPPFARRPIGTLTKSDTVTAYTATILDMNIDDVKKVFDINLFGLLSVTQLCAPLLLQSKGTIVNIGSMAALMAGPYSSVYNGSKISVEYLSHAMRQEMEPFGLKVVHVSRLSTFFYPNVSPSSTDIADG